ncbi:MAG: radical SAM protein [Anaerolineales bacterium]|nr:radical SAM protein [Anaerolineales bacterium]
MRLSGLHLLFTYQCTLECDHCFVWGSPWQSGTLTLRNVRNILQQAQDAGTVKWIYFEGGEPFLYYAVLLKAVQEAASMGFQVGIVSNGYWATDVEDALEWLSPFAELIQDLSVSSDLYHWSEKLSQQAQNANAAAEQLGIPLGVISIAEAEVTNAASAVGQLPEGESAVMYRGRAAEKLVTKAARWPWEQFTECPFEDLREPGRVHVDPYGNLNICQGISLGNLFNTPLSEICETYDPKSHPITGPLLEGGPVELVRRYELPHEEMYADACNLCYESCRALRERFPEILMPDQMYGVVEG